MRVAIIGSGHVGLVAAAGLAELGHQVICVDSDETKIESLRRGIVPIHERFLPELLARHRGENIHFTASMQDAVAQSEVIFITVGTPPRSTGEADLSIVEAVIREIAPWLGSYHLIVQKSTVPVCTNEWMHELLGQCGVSRQRFDVASNPEFLREGSAVTDFLFPDRVVIGATNPKAVQLLQSLYGELINGAYRRRVGALPAPKDAPSKPGWIVTSPKSAELIKNASNAFLAMKISYINAVANLCEAVGAEIDEVCEGIGSDRRIGAAFLSPGLGFGGSCFPKDLSAFQAVAKEYGMDFPLLQGVRDINEQQQRRFVRKVQQALWGLKGKKIAALGLAYKGGTEDVRESPAIEVINRLADEGCRVTAYDPAAAAAAVAVLPSGVKIVKEMYEAARDADALLILTDWEEFAQLDLVYLRSLMKQPLVIDGRNLYRSSAMQEAGFTYVSVGRADVQAERRERVTTAA